MQETEIQNKQECLITFLNIKIYILYIYMNEFFSQDKQKILSFGQKEIGVHSTGKQSLFNLRMISNTILHSMKLYAACRDHWSGNVGTLPSTCQVAAVNTLLTHTRVMNACNGSIVHGSVLFLVAPCISQNHLISTPTNAHT